MLEKLMDYIKHINSMLKFTANKVKDIGVIKSLSSGNSSISPRELTTYMSTTINPGIYIITTSSEWASDIPSATVIHQLMVGDLQIARQRGYMNAGGGITLTGIVEITSPSKVEYQLWQGHSAPVVARYGRMRIMQIATIGGGRSVKSFLSSLGRKVRFYEFSY